MFNNINNKDGEIILDVRGNSSIDESGIDLLVGYSMSEFEGYGEG